MGAVNTTYTFTATDTITSTKMNNIIDQTTMTNDAVFTGGTIEVVSGKLRVASGKITSNELADNSVTTSEILNSAITTAKIANSTSSTTGITTAKIADEAITTAKLADSTGTLTGVTTQKIANQSITAPKLSGAQSGTALIYGIRAWARVTSGGGITENKGFATISRASGGTYNLTLSATPTENPCVIVTAHPSTNFDWSAHVIVNSTSSFTVKTGWYSSWPDDCQFSIMVLY